MLHVSRGELALLLSGAGCVVLVGFVLLFAAACGVWMLRRTGRVWTMPIHGANLEFDDGAGWRWTVRLPRYNTLALQVVERDSGIAPDRKVMLTENPSLDLRFVFAAERSAQTQALLANRGFCAAMVAVPWLSLRLEGDELRLEDPELRGLEKAAGGRVTPGTPKANAAEQRVHRAVAALVTALFDSLYSKQTGTLLPEHR